MRVIGATTMRFLSETLPSWMGGGDHKCCDVIVFLREEWDGVSDACNAASGACAKQDAGSGAFGVCVDKMDWEPMPHAIVCAAV